MMGNCPICDGDLQSSITDRYNSCKSCNHEILVSGQRQTFMVNDDLVIEKILKSDLNVEAQLRCLNEVGVGTDCLIDVGCGSGKFLFHSKDKFSQVMGIEVSERSAQFATQKLGLRIEKMTPEIIDGELSAVTFWHSLEHIPSAQFKAIFENLHALSSSNSRVIISVPNAESLQYKLFKENFAYFDVPNHLHQFSIKSLDLLMQSCGFEFVSYHKMPTYDLFGYIQGAINNFISPANFLYYVLKRNVQKDEFLAFRKTKIILSALLSFIFLPLSLCLTIHDQVMPKKAGVITRCYRKAVV